MCQEHLTRTVRHLSMPDGRPLLMIGPASSTPGFLVVRTDSAQANVRDAKWQSLGRSRPNEVAR